MLKVWWTWDVTWADATSSFSLFRFSAQMSWNEWRRTFFQHFVFLYEDFCCFNSFYHFKVSFVKHNKIYFVFVVDLKTWMFFWRRVWRFPVDPSKVLKVERRQFMNSRTVPEVGSALTLKGDDSMGDNWGHFWLLLYFCLTILRKRDIEKPVQGENTDKPSRWRSSILSFTAVTNLQKYGCNVQ